MLDFDRFLNEVYHVKGYYTEIYDDKQYINLYVSDDFTGLNVSIFYRNRFYDWDTLVKFGYSKLLWYESCVINYHRLFINDTINYFTTENDYLVPKLFSPLSLSSNKMIMDDVKVNVDDDCIDSFSLCTLYTKPTVLMIDQPYHSEKDKDDVCYMYDDYEGKNFMALHTKSVLDYIKRPVGSTHKVKIAVFDNNIPSLTDYFENYNKVITSNNTFTITGTIESVINGDSVDQKQLVLYVSRCI